MIREGKTISNKKGPATHPKPKVKPAPQRANKNNSSNMSDYTCDIPSQIAVSFNSESKKELVEKVNLIVNITDNTYVRVLANDVLKLIQKNEKG